MVIFNWIGLTIQAPLPDKPGCSVDIILIMQHGLKMRRIVTQGMRTSLPAAQGKSWYWHIPSALEPWSALDDNAPLNGLFPTPEEALKAGRDYFYREVYSPTPEDLNEKEED